MNHYLLTIISDDLAAMNFPTVSVEPGNVAEVRDLALWLERGELNRGEG